MTEAVDADRSPSNPVQGADQRKRRAPRILQEDVPSFSLDQALRVARAIADNYAFKPTRPMNVAGAMRMSPTSGPFRTLTGAAVAYGLTTGAAQAPEIGLTPVGLRIVRPTTEGDDLAAKREALLKPRIIGEFLRGYDGAALPADTIAKNVLQEKGVPSERAADVLESILEGANSVGFIREWGGKSYVDLAGVAPTEGAGVAQEGQESLAGAHTTNSVAPPSTSISPPMVSVQPGIHINIEIHIAADASSDTIEEIFRNMRRYVLAGGPSDDDVAAER